MKIFNLIWYNLNISFFSSIFAALAILIVSGHPWGQDAFWFNTILFTIIFTIFDLIKNIVNIADK